MQRLLIAIVVPLLFVQTRIFVGANLFFNADSVQLLEKCSTDEAFGLIGCLMPITTLTPEHLNNATRGRLMHKVAECREMKACVNNITCAKKAKIDKTVDLLCDAMRYFVYDFTGCAYKLHRAADAPCMRQSEKMMHQIYQTTDEGEACKLMKKSLECAKKEVTEVCGQRDWLPMQKMLVRLGRLGEAKCFISVIDQLGLADN